MNKLWLVWNKKFGDNHSPYDCTDAFVFSGTKEQAMAYVPSGDYWPVSSKDIEIKLLGEGDNEPGVILTSFNAG